MPTSTKAYLRLVSGTSAGRAYAGFGIRWSPGSRSTRRSGSSSSGALIPEGVKDLHTRPLEVLDVASDYRKLMRPGRRRDQRVYNGKRLRVLLTSPGGRHEERHGQYPVGESLLNLAQPAL